jgi:CRP-like cAMP-binding protein
MEKTTDLVIGSSLGSELSQEEAGVIADLMSHREVVDGEFLIDEGATDDTLHVLLSGKLEVVKHTGAGETASLAILRPGALVGEMSFIDGAVHTVGLRALSDCRVLSLAPDEPRVHRTQQLHLQTARPLLKQRRCRVR